MKNTDRKQLFIIYVAIALAFAWMIGGLYITRATPEDIARCVDTSNYTYEQCKFELSR